MKKVLKRISGLLVVIGAMMLAGCATVPMASDAETTVAQQFSVPAKGKSGVYIYRDQSIFGASLKKNIYIDDKLIGQSAPGVFFYRVVDAGSHKISTESEFGNNDLNVTTESGKNYFFRQYIKLGVLVGGANLEQVNESKGKEAISKLKLAK